MDDKTLTRKLRELICEITESPEKMEKAKAKQKQFGADVTNSFQTLKICIKYIMLDLEATKRERNRLKKRLGEISDE